jgi:hypothetical protein
MKFRIEPNARRIRDPRANGREGAGIGDDIDVQGVRSGTGAISGVCRM